MSEYAPSFERAIERCSFKKSLGGKTPQTPADDTSIRDKVIKSLTNEHWARLALLSVTVQGGTVDLWGIVESQTEKDAVHILAEVTLGVRAVNVNLIVGAALGYS